MQYTPHSMAGMNNLTAELAAADQYSKTIKFFTVGMETACGRTADCSKPFLELAHGTGIRANNSAPCHGGASCRELWEPAGAATLGAAAWDHFSAVCFLTARDNHDALGGTVPLGLISSNWGGTPVQSWERDTGTLYNSMIAPLAVGPMALTGVTWYQVRRPLSTPRPVGCSTAPPTSPRHSKARPLASPRAALPQKTFGTSLRIRRLACPQGEANVGAAGFYHQAFPAMITGWRAAFANPTLWFGFVQIAGWAYSRPFGAQQCEQDHSWSAGDLRQAQLAALALPNVGFSTAIDTGGARQPVSAHAARA